MLTWKSAVQRPSGLIGLHHPLDDVTNPKYKLLRFIQLTFSLQKEEGTSFLPGQVLPSSALFMADPLLLHRGKEAQALLLKESRVVGLEANINSRY